ncbi:MAG: peptidoglycan-binding protein LysM [Prevotella sp.]|nr:peptidoglycan-binding protein LysM [Prevotella sp.]
MRRFFKYLLCIVALTCFSAQTEAKGHQDNDDVRNRAIRLGVMLPLHDENGDGRRMLEYYRGVLMACDSLKQLGISTDVYAWNLAEDGNLSGILADPNAARCDLIIGPLYSKQVPELSQFVERHGILMLIPFSINAPDLYTNRNLFQVYQSPNALNDATARRFSDWFKDYHPVIIDCGDTTSTKGAFTSVLRRTLEQKGMKYSITNLKHSSNAAFMRSFDVNKKNVVVLNTGRSPELNATFGRLSAVSSANPDIHIAVFGYTEWMMYAASQIENFHKYNVYLPAPFFTNTLSSATMRLQQKYRWNFHQDMMNSLPRFALTGFDHAYFFLRGLHQYGKTFDGAAGRLSISPVQTPLKFERVGNGGLQNRAYMFIHYMPEQQIEALNY